MLFRMIPFELGGTWISNKHTAVLDLMMEIGLDVYDASFLKNRSNYDDRMKLRNDDDDDDEESDNVAAKEEEDWPWWFWGVEYSDEEMERINKIILHLHPKEELSRKAVFQTPNEFLQAFDGTTLTELEAAGRKIQNDIETLGNGNCWEMSSVGSTWFGLDGQSTSTVLLFDTDEKSNNRNKDTGLLSTPDSRSILRNVIRNKNADDPNRVSYLYNLISFKGCNSDGCDSQYRVRGGTQAIPCRITDLLNNNDIGVKSSKVLLNSPVRCLRVFDNRSGKIIELLNNIGDAKNNEIDDKEAIKNDVRVEVETHDGRLYKAKAAIITGAPPVVSKISFEPALPLAQQRLLKQMPMGKSVKFAAVYNRGPWWRQHGLQGDILASGLPKELSVPTSSEEAGNNDPSATPLFGYCFDMSPFSRKVGVLTCFIEGTSYQYFTSLSQDRQEELMREFLRLSFEDLVRGEEEGDEKSLPKSCQPIWEPDSFVVADWGPKNPFVGGAYTSYFPPGVLSDPVAWKAYRQQEKLPNVFFAGADYHAGFGNGYVEGAIRSGQQAADMILQRITQD